jgi:chemosensory pili system protein ChpA (sensor histidine kinase/response regulator)
MAGKPDSGDGSGERASAPPWNAGETEMLRNLFLEEAEKHLGRIEEAQKLLSHATSSTLDISPDVVDVLFRHLHTLKGSAGSVGFDAVARAAHELEELCTEIRRGQLAPTFGILERIDEGVAEIRALLASARLSVPPPRSSEPPETVPNPKEMVDRRRSNDRRIVADRRGGGEGVLRVDVERLDALLRSVGDLVILRTRLDRRVHEMRSVLRDLGATRNGVRTAQGPLTLRDGAAGLRPAEPERGKAAKPFEGFLSSRDGAAGLRPAEPERGKAAKPFEGFPVNDETGRLLDRLGEVDVELTDTLSYLDRTARRLAEDADSMRVTSDELEEQIRRARLVPLEWAYSRLGSALHELERTCHRQADLLVHGGELELDKAIVDQLADPLLHLLRNSMAHGIESAPVRAERGKPARGRITIRASQEADFVFLIFEDDGSGIDRDAIRRILHGAGRLESDENASDESLVASIFEPGFSTREQSDALAGRGMGMNIVKRAVLRLGGEIKVESQAGAFTRFRLSLPLAGAITQGLLFKIGGQVYAVPAAHVLEVVPIGHNVLTNTPSAATSSGELPILAGVSVPILKLHALLGLELPPGRHAAAMHVRYAGRNFLITCDKVIGPRAIVVRPPGPLIGLIPIYAGVTASGAGKAQLVFDLGALADIAYSPGEPAPALPRRGQPRVLVADDSRLAREACVRMLLTAGYQAVAGEDGWEAWELLSERRFDAVVTALEMPRLDGFQLIARIRREATLRGLPIIVLSARTSKAARERAMAAGANVFLPKSRHRKSLIAAVAACLREHDENDPSAKLPQP